jgi:hypothetical protein
MGHAAEHPSRRRFAPPQDEVSCDSLPAKHAKLGGVDPGDNIREDIAPEPAGSKRTGEEYIMGRIIALAASGALLASGAASAATLLENSAEFRFQLDFHVNDAALQKLLPAGWEAVVATQGPAKDANLRVIFIDRVDVTNPNNAPKTADQLVYVAIPVKQTGTNNAGQMIIGGLVSSAKEAPGPFGNYTAAAAKVDRTFTTVEGVTRGQENWEFVAANGQRFEAHLKYERGPARLNPTSETKFFVPSNPSNYQVFKVDSGLDIMKNASVEVPDHHVTDFSYKASGGTLGALFDGTEKVLSWDSFHWYNRGIYTP